VLQPVRRLGISVGPRQRRYCTGADRTGAMVAGPCARLELHEQRLERRRALPRPWLRPDRARRPRLPSGAAAGPTAPENPPAVAVAGHGPPSVEEVSESMASMISSPDTACAARQVRRRGEPRYRPVRATPTTVGTTRPTPAPRRAAAPAASDSAAGEMCARRRHVGRRVRQFARGLLLLAALAALAVATAGPGRRALRSDAATSPAVAARPAGRPRAARAQVIQPAPCDVRILLQACPPGPRRIVAAAGQPPQRR